MDLSTNMIIMIIKIFFEGEYLNGKRTDKDKQYN